MRNIDKEDKSVQGGFESIMETFRSGFTPDDDDIPGAVLREPTEEEWEPPVKEDTEDHAKGKTGREEEKKTVSDNKDVEYDGDNGDIEDNDDVESEYVSGMFDVFAEQYGWDADDESKPKSIEDLMKYVDAYIDTNSEPSYANDTVRELNEFVTNGGRVEDYFSTVSTTNYEDVDLTNESNQRRVLTDLFKRQGFSDTQIKRKLDKYELADILEDEAEEAVETLRELVEKDKEQLLKAQEQQKVEFEKQQRAFYNNVVTEVEGLKDIRGVKIPEKDKKALLDYIFNPTKSGRTQYQEDYASSITNLVESAYFTKNKKQLIDSAKKEGEKTAVERFKQKLKSGNTATSKKTISSSGVARFTDLL
jgi:hypothetical protein